MSTRHPPAKRRLIVLAAEDAIVEEFATRYHIDYTRIIDQFREALPTLARKSASRLRASGATGVPAALAVLKRKDRPLLRRIDDEAQIDWTDDEPTWATFCELVDLLIDELAR